MAKTLFMIGHSIHPWLEFKELLIQHEIGSLIDVRSSPRSRNPQFNGNYLASNLAPVLYKHEPTLGGKDPLPIPRLKQEMRRLLESWSVQNTRTCFMCSEGDFHECHRHYLLAPLAIELGWDVVQIHRDGTLEGDTGPTAKTLKRMSKFLPSDQKDLFG